MLERETVGVCSSGGAVIGVRELVGVCGSGGADISEWEMFRVTALVKAVGPHAGYGSA